MGSRRGHGLGISAQDSGFCRRITDQLDIFVSAQRGLGTLTARLREGA